jgi:outer membrane protein, adhesin transport system
MPVVTAWLKSNEDQAAGTLLRRLAPVMLMAGLLGGCATADKVTCWRGASADPTASTSQNCLTWEEPQASAAVPTAVSAEAGQGAALSIAGQATLPPDDPQSLPMAFPPADETVASGETLDPLALLQRKAAGRSPETPASAPVVTVSMEKGAVTGAIGPTNTSNTLGGATSAALASSNKLRQQDARVEEADAGIELAATALNPTLDVRLSSGPAFKSTIPHDGSKVQWSPEGRLEAAITLKQLIYDFGATDRDIARAGLVRSSEVASLDDQAEDLAQKVALAYIRVLEGRSLLGVVDDTIAAHKRLAAIIQANEREGNGTAADVNRVASRLVDINAIRSDITLSMQAGEEDFLRLTGRQPGRLVTMPSLYKALPADSATALTLAVQRNPRLASIGLISRSLDEERAAQDLGTRPKFEIQVDGTSNNSLLRAAGGTSELEARALLSVRYKLWDGGVAAATDRQLEARKLGSDESYLDQRRTLESDIRQAYRAILAARNKGNLLRNGVSTAQNVQDLYLEQFKAGQRTVFELLDSQMSSFTARRSAVEARYEGDRAALTILRSIGSLRSAIATAGPGRGDTVFPGTPKKRRGQIRKSQTARLGSAPEASAITASFAPGTEGPAKARRLTDADNAPPPPLVAPTVSTRPGLGPR